MERDCRQVTIDEICSGLEEIFLLGEKVLDSLPSAFGEGYRQFRPERLFPMKTLNMPEACQRKPEAFALARRQNVYQQLVERYGKEETFFQRLMDYLETEWSFLAVHGHSVSVADELTLKAVLALIRSLTEEETESNSPFLVCSIDFLGIKDFKFQKKWEHHLSHVVGASIFIDIFREFVADAVFERVGVNRTCLIFSGGRHLHTILPNTMFVKQTLKRLTQEINEWLYTCVDETLSLSYGFCEVPSSYDAVCCDDMYTRIFTEIADMKEKMQIQPFSEETLCRIEALLLTGKLKKQQNEFSEQLKCFSERIREDSVYVIAKEKGQVAIGPKHWLSAVSCDEDSEEVACRYQYVQKGATPREYDSVGTSIWLGHFPYKKEYEDLKSQGDEIGILRIDVDDFKAKMLLEIKQDKCGRAPLHGKYELSRQFCLFLRGDVACWMKQNGLAVFLLHEGADDAFYIGPWKEMETFAEQLSALYRAYTSGEVTFSGGMCVYAGKDLMQVVNQAQKLLEDAKRCRGKNRLVANVEGQVYGRSLAQTEAAGIWTKQVRTKVKEIGKEDGEMIFSVPKPAYFSEKFCGQSLQEQKAYRKKKRIPINELETYLKGCRVVVEETDEMRSELVVLLEDLPYVGKTALTCRLLEDAGYYLKKSTGLWLAKGSCLRADRYRDYCQKIGVNMRYIGFYEINGLGK